MPLINTKLYLELNWTKHSIISNVAGATTFQITKNELYVPVVTLKTQNNNKSTELLRKGFKRSVIWNEYKSKIQTVTTVAAEGGNNDTKKNLLDPSYQGVNRLFVMSFAKNTVKRNTGDAESHRRYYLPRIKFKDYNILIDGRNIYYQNINDIMARYNELLNLTTERSEDYTTGCLIDYEYYINDYNIAAINLKQQSILDSDPKAIQQIEFIYKLENDKRALFLTVLEKEKETSLEFSKGTVKVY